MKIGAYASNVEAQAMYILSGHFIGYLPDHMAAMLKEKDRLRALLGPEVQIRSPFVIILPNHKRASLPLRMFIQELRKRVAAPRPHLPHQAYPAPAFPQRAMRTPRETGASKRMDGSSPTGMFMNRFKGKSGSVAARPSPA